ncbi:MAG TPA: DUF4260 domain-containing protein [Candidatus Saccharimonadales bacterium]
MNKTITIQRLEAGAVFITATFIYVYNDLSLIYFLLLLFVFDLFMVGYFVSSRVGALVYNVGHSFIIPTLLTGLYVLNESDVILGLACLWFAHIGLDRALGYGLKHDSGFAHTHLGKIGKQ